MILGLKGLRIGILCITDQLKNNTAEMMKRAAFTLPVTTATCEPGIDMQARMRLADSPAEPGAEEDAVQTKTGSERAAAVGEHSALVKVHCAFAVTET